MLPQRDQMCCTSLLHYNCFAMALCPMLISMHVIQSHSYGTASPTTLRDGDTTILSTSDVLTIYLG